LLVGEQLRIYQDRDRSVQVCELCRDRALQRGWEAIGPIDTPRLRVQPNGAVTDIVDRDALIDTLGTELSYLREQLGAATSALSEHTMAEDTVRAITDKLRCQERELERLRRDVREVDPVLVGRRSSHARTPGARPRCPAHDRAATRRADRADCSTPAAPRLIQSPCAVLPSTPSIRLSTPIAWRVSPARSTTPP